MSEQAEIETPSVQDANPISTAVVEYSELMAGLNEMQKLRGMAYDLRTVKGNEDARRDRRKLVTSRTWLEKRRVELNRADRASIAERVALRDTEAVRLEGLIRALETPIDEQIAADEFRRETERVEKLRAEEARTSIHRERITDIANVAVRAAGMSASDIDSKIALVTRIDIDASFEEFEAVAGNTKFETLLKLKELHAAALLREEAAAEVARNKERLAVLEREAVERQQREDAERREREALEVQHREAQHKAEAARRAQCDASNALIDEIRRVQRRAFSSSASGMLELVTLIENIRIGDELGDFAGVSLKARDDALADLHQAHKAMLAKDTANRAAEVQQQALREEQAATQKRLDESAAELDRKQRVIDAHELAAKLAEAQAAVDATVLAAHLALRSTEVPDVVVAEPEIAGDPAARLLSCAAALLRVAIPIKKKGPPTHWAVPASEIFELRLALSAVAQTTS